MILRCESGNVELKSCTTKGTKEHEVKSGSALQRFSCFVFDDPAADSQ